MYAVDLCLFKEAQLYLHKVLSDLRQLQIQQIGHHLMLHINRHFVFLNDEQKDLCYRPLV